MSFPDDLDQHALPAIAVKFPVEDLFPGTEIQFAFRDGHHHFTAHDLAFQMRVGVVLARAIVTVLRGGFVRREFFQPRFVIGKQSVLGVIDENGGSAMRCPFATCK